MTFIIKEGMVYCSFKYATFGILKTAFLDKCLTIISKVVTYHLVFWYFDILDDIANIRASSWANAFKGCSTPSRSFMTIENAGTVNGKFCSYMLLGKCRSLVSLRTICFFFPFGFRNAEGRLQFSQTRPSFTRNDVNCNRCQDDLVNGTGVLIKLKFAVTNS